MTSRPLLTSVAELVVITRPIAKLGCASACSGVTSASSSAVRPRNGPPDAVRTRRRTSSAEPARRHWAMAQCSESTGHDLARPRALLHQRAADDERLLVGEGQRGAGVEGGQGGAEADGAGDAVEHDVARPSRRPRWTPPPPARSTPARTPRPGPSNSSGLDRRRSGRPRGTGRGGRGRGRAPGCRWTRSSRGSRCRGQSPLQFVRMGPVDSGGADWRALAHAEQLLDLRRDVEAEQRFRDVLTGDPGSGRALLGLAPRPATARTATPRRSRSCAARSPSTRRTPAPTTCWSTCCATARTGRAPSRPPSPASGWRRTTSPRTTSTPARC